MENRTSKPHLPRFALELPRLPTRPQPVHLFLCAIRRYLRRPNTRHRPSRREFHQFHPEHRLQVVRAPPLEQEAKERSAPRLLQPARPARGCSPVSCEETEPLGKGWRPRTEEQSGGTRDVSSSTGVVGCGMARWWIMRRNSKIRVEEGRSKDHLYPKGTR